MFGRLWTLIITNRSSAFGERMHVLLGDANKMKFHILLGIPEVRQIC